MRKILIVFFISCFLFSSNAFAWKKKPKPILFLSSSESMLEKEILENNHGVDVFHKNERIYFLAYSPKGFASKYIKYQIVKQDDKAFEMGYSRVRSKTCLLQNSNYYTDYFVLSQNGKYYIQIFDITNLNHWIVGGNFLVVD